MTTLYKIIIPIMIVIGIFINVPIHASADLSSFGNGLVGYWPFDTKDGLSKGIAWDRSGNGNTGTLVSSPTTVVGEIGQALNFASTSHQYVNMGNDTAATFGATDSFTVSLWIYSTGGPSGTSGAYLEKSTGLPNSGIGYIIYAGGNAGTGLNYYIGDGTNHVSNTINGGLVLNQWVQFAMVIDRNAQTITPYLNGVQQHAPISISTVGPLSNSSNLLLGQISSRYVNAALDDVRIYNRALSVQEIKQLYLFGLQSHTK